MNEAKKIIYNCQQATLLIEKKQLARLTTRENLELRLHLAGCSICQIFERQSIVINKQVKNLFHPSNPKKHVLDDAYKQVLQEHIEEKLK